MPDAASASPPRRPRVIVLGPADAQAHAESIRHLRPLIEQHTEVARWDADFSTDLSDVDAEMALVLGGDGSILRSARQMGYRQLPVVGVNLGKLGFLADLSPDELPTALPFLAEGNYAVIDHLMFQCQHLRDGKVLNSRLALNEAAIRAGNPFHILDIELYVDAELATSYSCDGLIVGTPIGSTAHCLSAGGPILRKDLQAVVICPISPHTLTNRPVVDSADRVYELVVAPKSRGASAVVDGRTPWPLEPHDRVRISRAEPTFQLVRIEGHGYYRTLREKLGWSGKLRMLTDAEAPTHDR